jgi:PAS domain S-box-containing protein
MGHHHERNRTNEQEGGTQMSLRKQSSLEDSQASLIAQLQGQVLNLRQTIDYNHDVLMEAKDGVIKIDNNRIIIFCNKAATSMFGYLPGDLLGLNVKILMPQRHKGNYSLFFKSSELNAAQQAVETNQELEATKKDGSKFWIDFSVVKKRKGADLEHTIFIKDISAQKVVVDSLAELHRELDARINLVNVSCVVSELDLNGNITYVNDLMCELSQYTREECIGQPHSMFRHQDTPVPFFDDLWTTLKSGKTFRGILKNRKKDGSAYWEDAVISPVLGSDGQPIKYIGVRYVITDLIEREEELKKLNEEQADNLLTLNELMVEKETQTLLFEKVNGQMEKFLYSTSHDLRSPITTIMGLVQIMRMEIKDETVRDYISKIEKSANKLDKTIKDIMTYSISAYQHLDSQRIDFKRLAWEIWNGQSDHDAFHKIRMEIAVKGEAVFFIDIKRMKTILTKLIDNALQFHDVNKALPFIRIIIAVESEQVTLEVADNGIGIGASYLNEIFTMFFKASHISTGAGLGLFLVKEAMAQLRGEIEVESEIGFGSVFRIIIPNSHKGKLMHRKMLLMNPKSTDSQ